MFNDILPTYSLSVQGTSVYKRTICKYEVVKSKNEKLEMGKFYMRGANISMIVIFMKTNMEIFQLC